MNKGCETLSEFRFTEQKPTSLRHKITEDIRKAIFQGKLKPRDRLREMEISKQMGVSRGPVREAMRMLEQEGLIYSHPYKESMVADISTEEVHQVLIPIRLTIETFAIRKALPLLGEAELNHLAEIVADMKEAAGQGNLSRLVENDLAFHEFLINLADAPGLLNTWTSIYNRIRLYFLMQGETYGDLHELWEEHESLLRTIEAGDADRIVKALEMHIRKLNPKES